ncbi:hypothetical protein EV421DRAFT_1862550 [Armillaria borealis]|uniref:Uncharacterized protein n=1 Tax=Armillaria borealis TaxID=47425 RepID=A0AA39ISY3_9AGAR|nr:hypothetical protein EV421DRAFT_1862550 [Armillaria borealis]
MLIDYCRRPLPPIAPTAPTRYIVHTQFLSSATMRVVLRADLNDSVTYCIQGGKGQNKQKCVVCSNLESGTEVRTCKSTNTRKNGVNALIGRTEWKRRCEYMKQMDSPSPATKITSNLLIAVNRQRKRWLYAVALVPFQIYSAILMSSTPLVASGP